ncbi:unnamed protein product [Diabrotica balteata]|uniref:Uncharacterized protein n=1 Tax=Diabrotica balteata TaxID=107213 RepID=A0A9N9T2W6_DIABA|nr:unnamed protein product [Diabrotica balteata]
MAALSYLLIYGMLHHFVLDDSMYKGKCTVTQFDEASKVREECLKSITGALDLVNTKEIPVASPISFARKQCTLKTQINGCVEKANEIVKDCFDTTQNHAIDVWKKIDTEIYDYLCGNKGRVSFTYYRRESTCWKDGVGNASATCIKNNIKSELPLYDIAKLQDHCSEFSGYEKCMTEDIPKTCPQDTITILLPIIKSIKNGICNDIVPGQDDYKQFFKQALSGDFMF